MIDSITLHRIKTLFGEPEFIKNAGAPTTDEELHALPFSCFADQAKRQYPIHNKEATWLSNATFWETSIFDPKASPKTGEELLKAATYWDIEDDIREMLQKVSDASQTRQKEDLPDDVFALVATRPTDGNQLRMFPTFDPDMVKKSAEQFYAERTLLPLQWRRVAAQNLLKAAQDQNVNINNEAVEDYLNRAAGKGMSSTSTLIDALIKRANILHDTKRKSAARDLVQIANKLEGQETSRELCEKMAEKLDILDRNMGLYQRYATGLDLPEESCHRILAKHARSYADALLTLPTGRHYKKADLARVGPKLFALVPAYLSEATTIDGSLDMVKTAKCIGEMTIHEARNIEHVLSALGIEPETVTPSLETLDQA